MTDAVKLDPKRWSPSGEHLVQIKGPGGSRVIRKSELADYERRGFEVEAELAKEPFDASNPEAEPKLPWIEKAKDKPKAKDKAK